MKVKDYKVTPLTFDEKVVKQVMDRVAKEESIAVIAKKMGIGPGRAAMAVLIGTTERKTIEDPAALARAIAKDRKAKASWGLLAAKYGVTEGTARAAFEAATGEPFSSIDYSKKGAAK